MDGTGGGQHSDTPPTKDRSERERPNVLFLILDSLRTDRVSSYNHDRETTPHLDRFATSATRYTNAYTPAPWTLPTHTSLFTGLFPSEHGVTNVFGDGGSRLSDEVPTLAESLQLSGYRTAGFSNNPWVGKTSGLDRGFEDYVEWNLEIRRESDPAIHSRVDRVTSRLHSVLGHAARQPVYVLKRPFFTDSLTRRAKSWIQNTSADDRPWFCFMNLMEAHSPYFPRKWAFQELGLEPPTPIEPRVLNMKLLANVAGKTDLEAATRRRVMEFYDASVRYQDRKVGELLDVLRTCDAFDNTLIVICSDHGKTLGEFDRNGTPPHYVRDVNTRVPLFVKAPHQTNGRVSESPVELVSTHYYILDGGTAALGSYQPSSDYALFEDFIPHTGRAAPDEGVRHWRGLGTADGKFVRNDNDETFLFEGKGLDERPVAGPNGSGDGTLADALSKRVGALEQSPSAAKQQDVTSLEDDVQAQLKDLGYLK